MASVKNVIFVTVLLFASAYSNKLPDFIKLCKASDPNLNECALKHAKEAMPHLLQGYKQFKLPSLSPLKLSSLEVETGPNLKLSFQNMIVDGFNTLDIIEIKIDDKNKKASVKLHGKELIIEGTYDIKGQILILPISGNGPAHIKFVDADFIFSFDWGVTDKDGINYAVVQNERLTYTTGRSYFKLENLFNGDKTLGDQMNKFLDENWQEVNKELGPSISETIKLIVHGILEVISTTVPLESILPP